MMAVAVLSTPASMTAEQYHQITEHLDAARTGPPPGRRFHVCFGHGDHLMVFDVWDSLEELDAFTATRGDLAAAGGVATQRATIIWIEKRGASSWSRLETGSDCHRRRGQIARVLSRR
jgi:hypothetical protein